MHSMLYDRHMCVMHLSHESVGLLVCVEMLKMM